MSNLAAGWAKAHQSGSLGVNGRVGFDPGCSRRSYRSILNLEIGERFFKYKTAAGLKRKDAAAGLDGTEGSGLMRIHVPWPLRSKGHLSDKSEQGAPF